MITNQKWPASAIRFSAYPTYLKNPPPGGSRFPKNSYPRNRNLFSPASTTQSLIANNLIASIGTKRIYNSRTKPSLLVKSKKDSISS